MGLDGEMVGASNYLMFDVASEQYQPVSDFLPPTLSQRAPLRKREKQVFLEKSAT